MERMKGRAPFRQRRPYPVRRAWWGGRQKVGASVSSPTVRSSAAFARQSRPVRRPTGGCVGCPNFGRLVDLRRRGGCPWRTWLGGGGGRLTFGSLWDYSTFTEGAGDVRYFLLGKADCQTKHAAFEADARAYAGRCCK